MKFSKVNVEISNICNLQCSFCPEVIRDKQMMSLELFREVIRQVAPLTDQVAFHLMGDPLVHPRLGEFLDICSEHSVRVFLVTNGVLLREKQAELLLHPALRQVNFSLHSFHDNFGDRDPSTYLERIFLFTERALTERPDLYVNYRLWNLSDPRGTGERNRGMLKRVEERFGVSARDDLDVRTQKSQKLRGRLYLHFDTEFVWPSLDLPDLGPHGRCHGLSSHFGVLVDGTVVPCCLDKEGKIPLGRVTVGAGEATSIAEILAGERARAILKGFRERRLVEDLCRRCGYIERFGRQLTKNEMDLSRVPRAR